MKRWKVAVAAFVVALSTIGCGGSPTAPSPNPGPPAPAVLSISSLPYDEVTKTLIWEGNVMYHGGGKRTVRVEQGRVMRHFGEGIAIGDIHKAVALWDTAMDGLLDLEAVATSGEANAFHRLEYPIAGLSANGCAIAGPDTVVQYSILTSRARYALGAKDGCRDRQWDYILVAHEIGHMLGMAAHTPPDKTRDVMSANAVFVMSDTVRNALRWLHTVPAGTEVVR